MKIRQFLLTLLPDFCYQDYSEIVKMADKYCEKLDDYMDKECLRVTLSNLVKAGKIEARFSPRKGIGCGKRGFIYVYRRVS